ncbi:MAG: hypothetical protein GF353_21140 [Candidatus Lokiarchaeota archaeon]|nr:hypothetical protein [Candidatus Lokiarchaeota archaeon]
MEEGWDLPYEFTITSESLTWAIDYNHHHLTLIVGNLEANRAYRLLGRRRWALYTRHRNFYQKSR